MNHRSHSPFTHHYYSRSRSRSPGRRSRHRNGNSHTRRTSTPAVALPFRARQLSKHDLRRYKPMFAMYLDIQKGLFIEDLSTEEIKGRWKSFVGKWNRGELADGWYDPTMLEKAHQAVEEGNDPDNLSGGNQLRPVAASAGDAERRRKGRGEDADDDDDDDDGEYGPSLPSFIQRSGQAAGPTIPTTQDLQMRKVVRKQSLLSTESAAEDGILSQNISQEQRRADIRSHRVIQQSMEEEVAPRAEPGTRERRLEKRRESAAANRSFAELRRDGSPIFATTDEELMGAGESDLTEIRKSREKEERRKNEREIKREEILRARAAEREDRIRRYQQKEEETIGWLKALAKQRFG